jgi:hypothetical protein
LVRGLAQASEDACASRLGIQADTEFLGVGVESGGEDFGFFAVWSG